MRYYQWTRLFVTFIQILVCCIIVLWTNGWYILVLIIIFVSLFFRYYHFSETLIKLIWMAEFVCANVGIVSSVSYIYMYLSHILDACVNYVLFKNYYNSWNVFTVLIGQSSVKICYWNATKAIWICCIVVTYVRACQIVF